MGNSTKYLISIITIGQVFLASLSIAAQATVQQDKTLTIGIHERANYREKSANGQWYGIDIQLLDAIFAQTAYRYKLVELPWQRTLNSLQQGKVDMTVSAALLPERQNYAWFSKQVFRDGHNVLFTLKSKLPLFENVSSLSKLMNKNLRLGVVRGVSYSDEYDELASETWFSSNLIYLADTAPLADMLIHNRIDAYLDSEYGGMKIISENPDYQHQIRSVIRITSPEEAQTHLMFSKKTVTPEVVAIFDAALATLISDGTYQAILAN